MQSVAMVIAADNPQLWQTHVESLRGDSGPTLEALWADLADAVARWNHDPAATASRELVDGVYSGARSKRPPHAAEPTVLVAVGNPRRPEPPMEMSDFPANSSLREESWPGEPRSEQPTSPKKDELKLLHWRDRRIGRSR